MQCAFGKKEEVWTELLAVVPVSRIFENLLAYLPHKVITFFGGGTPHHFPLNIFVKILFIVKVL